MFTVNGLRQELNKELGELVNKMLKCLTFKILINALKFKSLILFIDHSTS